MTDSLSIAIARGELPFSKPFTTANQTFLERQVALVRIAAGGVYGYGEASPLPGFSSETYDQALAVLESASGVISDLECPGEAEEIPPLLAAIEGLESVPSARFALECALLDLVAKRKRTSIAQLLMPRGAATDVAVNATIGAESVPACFAAALTAFEQGFTCFKLKVGGRPFDEDLARIKAVRDAIGDASTLRLDTNGSWQRQEAIENIARMRPFDIALIEQPVAADDFEGLALVRASAHVRIAADESVRSASDLERLLELDAVDCIVLKPMMLGGLLTTLKLQRHALERGVTTILTTSLESAVGRVATLHLAAACQDLEGPCGLATGALLSSDTHPAPPAAHGGKIPLPDGEGLGLVPELSFEERRLTTTPGVLVPHPLLQRARYLPEQTAIRAANGTTWSYATLARMAKISAQALRSHTISHGDRVGVLATNHPLLAAVIHGISLLGGVAILLHPQQTSVELAAKLKASRPRLVVASSGLVEKLGEHPCVLLESLFEGEPADEATLQQRVSLDALHSVVFTSGTTGDARLVALSWQNLIFSATGSAIQLGHLPTDRWLAAMPLCHVAGLSIVMRCVILGTTVELHETFDASACADAIVEGKATMISVVARMLREILEALGGRRPSPAFRLALVGGGPIPPDLLAASSAAGIPCSPTYGMSEGASQLATRPPTTILDGANVGWPLIWTEMRLANEPEGELEARGPTISPGYMSVRDGEHVLEPGIDEEGWFATGDWGARLDDHSFEILDRRTDRIVSGGENVSPTRVENVLRQLGSVDDVCVVGMPDPDWGHRVVAVVTLKPGEQITEDEILAACATRLATFETPREVHFWDVLPRSSLMKISRQRVRQRLSQGTMDEKKRAR
ncbi:MAG: o-succinylbenzoate synthase [Myxococcota bacterium]|nr:o-succinylbenzoate synthase [Myxococcota bacterium]MEC9440532.1 o-succinylbenzoate synthase [Myxococcota bacterium]